MINYEGKLIAWAPIAGINNKFDIASIKIDLDGFQIILIELDNNQKRKISIHFPYGVRSYRATDELLSINAFAVENNDLDNSKSVAPWQLFKAVDSEYLQWASKRSDGISDSLGLIHFMICTQDWIIEILNHADPVVQFIDDDKDKICQ